MAEKRKVDVFADKAQERSALKIAKQQRERRNPMNNPELRQTLKPSRTDREDIYGPGKQD